MNPLYDCGWLQTPFSRIGSRSSFIVSAEAPPSCKRPNPAVKQFLPNGTAAPDSGRQVAFVVFANKSSAYSTMQKSFSRVPLFHPGCKWNDLGMTASPLRLDLFSLLSIVLMSRLRTAGSEVASSTGWQQCAAVNTQLRAITVPPHPTRSKWTKNDQAF